MKVSDFCDRVCGDAWNRSGNRRDGDDEADHCAGSGDAGYADGGWIPKLDAREFRSVRAHSGGLSDDGDDA